MMQLCTTTHSVGGGLRAHVRPRVGFQRFTVACDCGLGCNGHEWPGLSVAALVAQFLFIPTLQVCNALQPTTNSRQI